MIMLDIEPELTSNMVPMLEVLYVGESQEDRKARYEWYTKALTIADDRVKMITDLWHEQFGQLKVDIMAMIQQKEDEADASVTKKLEDDIANNSL